MSDAIAKASPIPERARFDAHQQEWEQCEFVDGLREGVSRRWRADGTLRSESTYRKGKLHGHLQRFHPNGQVAWDGHFLEGRLHGEIVVTACLEATPERLRTCCNVPPQVWQIRTFYERGSSSGDRLFDREGRRLLADGTLFPARPSALPDAAVFEENGRRWILAERDGKRRHHGEWRSWFPGGDLADVGAFETGKRSGTWRRFAEGGRPIDSVDYSEGLRHGPFTDHEVRPGELADAHITQIAGHFERDVPVGSWEFKDSQGSLLKRIDLGLLPSEESLQPCSVFADVEQPTEVTTWAKLAELLLQQRQFGAALCALVRDAAQGGNAEMLRAALNQHTAALTPRASAALLESHRKSWVQLVHALARGAEPVEALRALSSMRSIAKRARRDFVEAGLLLAGQRADLVLARATLRLEFGDLPAALADAETLDQLEPTASAFVRDLSGVLFAPFDFEPIKLQLPKTQVEQLPEAPAQPLAAVKTAIAKCALRLMQLRTALQKMYFANHLEAHALPPDLSQLLPGSGELSDVRLGRWQFEIEEDGEQVQIQVDETLDVDRSSAFILLARTRIEWTTLCWLCWGAGMTAAAQPQVLKPPAQFNPALAQSIERVARCRDQVTTGGMLSRRKGFPGFHWRGFDVATLSGPLLQMALDEQIERRAILFWLADEECQSPWQDDLRPV